jgi:hypothetical protein
MMISIGRIYAICVMWNAMFIAPPETSVKMT